MNRSFGTPDPRPGSATAGMPAASAAPGLGPTHAGLLAEEERPRIRGYDVSVLLGRGGMGVVWRAVQQGTKRAVALKLLGAGLFASPAARRRFEREVEIAARLGHPNIARIYASGLDQGVYYFAMELIDGLPLDRYVAEHKLPERQVLELMATTCRAVQHAHQLGLIHRDLKPSNILVTPDGQPHVVDFGLAKSVADDGDGAAAASVSRDGEIAGTLAFMSPQQAAGKRLDTRTDVYSLGVILYQLLTGSNPHDMRGSDFEVIRRVVQDEIARPRSVNPQLDNDLESLLLKALAKDPDQRYSSAGDLARDIENYLAGEPLAARRPTTGYFLLKRLRKYRVRVGIAAAVLAAFATLAVVNYIQVVRAIGQADQSARDAYREAEAKRIEAGRADEHARRASVSAAEMLSRMADAMVPAGRLRDAIRHYLDSRKQLGDLKEGTFLPDSGLTNVYRYVPPPLLTVDGHAGGATDVVFLPDGRRAVSGDRKGTVTAWDVRTGAPKPVVAAHTGAVLSIAVSSGKNAAGQDVPPILVSAGGDGTLRLYDTQPAVRALPPIPAAGVRAADISRDGSRVVSAHADGRIRLWEVTPEKGLREIGSQGMRASCVRFLPDTPHGARVAWLAADRQVWVWDTQSAAATPLSPVFRTRPGVERFGASADGGLVLTQAEDYLVAPRDTGSPRRRNLINSAGADAVCFAFSPDGLSGAAGYASGEVKVWRIGDRAVYRTFVGHAAAVRAIAFAPPGSPVDSLVLTAADDGTVKVWDTREGNTVRTVTMPRQVRWEVRRASYLLGGSSFPRPSHSTEGGMLVMGASDEGTVNVVDAATGCIVRTFHQRHGISTFTPSGGILAFVPPLAAGAAPLPPGAVPGAFAPDGRSAVTVAADGTLTRWTFPPGKAVPVTLGKHPGPVYALAMSATDGRWVLTGGADGSLWAWDVNRLGAGTKLTGHTSAVRAVAFLPGVAPFALSGGEDGRALKWDVANGKRIGALQLPDEFARVEALAVNPGGDLALIAPRGGPSALLWDLAGDREIRALTGHGSPLCYVGFLPPDPIGGRGDVAVTADAASVMKMWDLTRATRYEVLADGVAKAQAVLRTQPTNPKALTTLADWYAFRGVPLWAMELLEAARANDATPNLTLARSYLEAGSGTLSKPEPARLAKAWIEYAAVRTGREHDAYLSHFRSPDALTQDPGPPLVLLGSGQTSVQGTAGTDRTGLVPASGPRTDLLVRIDPALDLPQGLGRWRVEGGSLVAYATASEPFLFRHQPPAQYDFVVEFTRQDGQDMVAMLMSRPPATTDGTPITFSWIMGGWGNTVFGLHRFNGEEARANATTVQRGLNTGRRYTAVVQVRDRVVRTYLDGELVLSQATAGYVEFRHDDPGSKFTSHQLGLRARNGTTVFHRVEVIEAPNGDGTPPGPATAPTTRPFRVEPPPRVVVPNAGERLNAAVVAKAWNRSPAAGAAIGNPFEQMPAAAGMLVGFVVTSDDAGRIRSLQPIFRAVTDDKESRGAVVGEPGRVSQEFRAAPAYAVGGLLAHGGAGGLAGFRLQFVRVNGLKLDRPSAYLSPWVGMQDARLGETFIGGDGGKLAIGVYGTAGPDAVTSLGLMQLNVSHAQEKFDLLALMKPEELAGRTINGKWSRTPEGYLVAEQGDSALIEIPFQPPEEYDLVVKYVAPNSGTIAQNLYAAGLGFRWVASLRIGGAFELHRERELAEGIGMNPNLTAGGVYTYVIKVRRTEVTAVRDGKEHMRRELKDLSPNPKRELRHKAWVGVGKFGGRAEFRQIELIDMTDVAPGK